MPGSRRSPPKPLVRAVAAFAAFLATAASPPPVAIEADAIRASLTGTPGDLARGRAIVASRQLGLCLLCHAAPIPEERFQGNLAPDLRGVGARLTPGQIRLRLVDASQVNHETIMPPYRRSEGFSRVGHAWQGRSILSDAQIEDVVAWLVTLREE